MTVMCGCQGHREDEPDGSWLGLIVVILVAAVVGAVGFAVMQWFTS